MSGAIVSRSKKSRPRRPSSSSSAKMAFFSCFSCSRPQEEDISWLDFSHQRLDNVPQDIFAYERTLEQLCLSSNNIRDLPRQLFQCQELRELDLSDNDVHQLPPAVSSLAQLVRLNVSKNVLTEIPDTVKQLKQLAVLDASINPLQKMPEGCTQLLSITELYLNDTCLEFLPANFGRLAKLRILELRENALNTLPKSLSRLTGLQRLDLGQNEISELPEVVGTLTELTELWVDANRIKQIPAIIGNLTKLNHFEASLNHIDFVSEAIGHCRALTSLAFSSNDLRKLPDTLGELVELVTLKLDDNQLDSVPSNIGNLSKLEELILSENYLDGLPPSLGLCRKLHTLNVDDNDIEFVPKEIGSCTALRILSAHGNRLTTLPAELDHISKLAVINLTGNMIQNLPVSFMKLTNISALWLSENQNKPLIQLHQDTDPETGQRVLTNFMLPQQPESDFPDNLSDSGSFHASVWEEQRLKKSQVKWAGEGGDEADEDLVDMNGGRLRREPTPFPKEMRAMAKRVQNMRSKGDGGDAAGTGGSGTVLNPPRKKSKDSRPPRPSSATSHPPPALSASKVSNGNGHAPDHTPANGKHLVQIREAKVSKPHASPALSERHLLSVYEEEKRAKEQMELKQFEDFERSLTIVDNGVGSGGRNTRNATNEPLALYRHSPDKTSRDSGVITPSDGSVTSPENEHAPLQTTTRKPSDPLPQAPHSRGSDMKTLPPPVAAEVKTIELHDETKPRPPPYHIAAALSKRAGDFSASASSSPQQRQLLDEVDQRSSGISDDISESEVSTAPSSLQTIVRAPMDMSMRAATTDSSSTSSYAEFSAANTPLQQPLQQQRPSIASSSTARTSILPVAAQSQIASLKKPSVADSCSESEYAATVSHANHLRKVSEQLLSNPRTRQSVTGIPVLGGSSRPGSLASPTSGSLSSSGGGSDHLLKRPGSQLGFQQRPGSFAAAPPNTVGLPGPSPPVVVVPSPASSTSNGLLTTIERAAHSDEENLPSPPLPPPTLSKIPSLLPKNPPPRPESYELQPNYENVSTPTKPSMAAAQKPAFSSSSTTSASNSRDRISTSQFVAASKVAGNGSFSEAVHASPSASPPKMPSRLPTRPGSAAGDGSAASRIPQFHSRAMSPRTPQLPAVASATATPPADVSRIPKPMFSPPSATLTATNLATGYQRNK